MTSAASRKPPIPHFLYGIVNPVMGAILRSPLHGLLSPYLVLVTFRGRRTGREFSAPVGYRQDGDALQMLVHGAWWKNLRPEARVRVQLRGRERMARAAATQDGAVLLPWLRRRLAEIGGVRNARRMGISELDPSREPTDDELLYAVRGAALVRVELEPV
jgi:hypothetical protein